MTAPLAFIDTETTSLRPDRRAWDIAVIHRAEDGTETEHQWFVEHDDLDLGNADLMALKIGRFHDRHPGKWAPTPCGPERWVMEEAEGVTRGAHLVGAVVSFDAEVLAARMRAHGICPSWHYRVQCIETLALGWLAGQGKSLPDLPWRSDELSRLIGVDPPGPDERHTALGDARWAARLWDAITGGARWA